MEIVVNNEWLKESIRENFLTAVKILFLFTNDIKEALNLSENVFLKLSEKEGFESQRYFMAWFLHEVLRTGKGARIKHKEDAEEIFSLGESERMALFFRNYEGFNLREISGVMRIPENTAENAIESAEEHLKSDETALDRSKFDKIFEKIYMSEEVSEKMNELLETNKLEELKRLNDLKRERGRKITWIASLVLIAICLLIGSGVLHL